MPQRHCHRRLSNTLTMALSFLYLHRLPLRRTIGAAVFFALYSGLIPFSEANEHLYLEYLVFTHQKPYKFSAERDTWPDQLLTLSALSRIDRFSQSSHSLISDAGFLKGYSARLKKSPLYRVTLHAQTELTTSGQIAPVRFRIKRKRSQGTSDIRIAFQYGGLSKRRVTTNVLYAPFPEEVVTSDAAHSQSSRNPDSLPWILRDSRRLDVGEVHYLGHPAFGILLVLAEKN